VPDMINDISIADYDKSMLLLSLNTAILQQEKVSLSFSNENIASSGLVLDSLDHYFVYNAVGKGAIAHTIPGRVEAEDFFEMSGIQTEVCSDIGGGENVGYIDPGDWMKYDIQVDQSGLYTIICRMAGYSNGTLLIDFNNSPETEVDYTATNGWQTWQDFSTSAYLEAGNYTMEVQAQTDAFNINYFDFKLDEISIDQPIAQIRDIKVYPNPLTSQLSIEFVNTHSRNATIKLIDPTGKYVQELYRGGLIMGTNTFRFSINSALPVGVYFIEIKGEAKRHFKKIIKK